MKFFVVTVVVVLIAWAGLSILKEGGNVVLAAAKALDVVPPIRVEYEWRYALFYLGTTERLIITNLSEQMIRPTGAVVTTASGTKYNIVLPKEITSHQTVDVRMRAGDGFFAQNIGLKEGDTIDVLCAGYPLPRRLYFTK